MKFSGCCNNGFVDTALQVHWICSCCQIAMTFHHNRLCQNGCRRSPVSCHIRSFGSNFFEHLCSHILKLVFQFNFFRNGDAVFRDQRGTKGLVNQHVAAFGAKRNFYRVGHRVDATKKLLAIVRGESNLFSCHDFSLS